MPASPGHSAKERPQHSHAGSVYGASALSCSFRAGGGGHQHAAECQDRPRALSGRTDGAAGTADQPVHAGGRPGRYDPTIALSSAYRKDAGTAPDGGDLHTVSSGLSVTQHLPSGITVAPAITINRTDKEGTAAPVPLLPA